MKVVLAKLTGTPSVGGEIQLHYLGNRGGRSTIGYIVRDGDTVSNIIDQLAGSVDRPGTWTADLKVKAKEDTLAIYCSESYSGITFVPQFINCPNMEFTLSEI